jgi:hypothetical protein
MTQEFNKIRESRFSISVFQIFKFHSIGLPLFLGRSIADGFLMKPEFSELGSEAIHFLTLRVVFGQESLFEKQELVLRSVGVVDDGDEEPLEVDLDAGEQLWQRG